MPKRNGSPEAPAQSAEFDATFEQADLDAYIEGVKDNEGDEPTKEERIAYYWARYEKVKATYAHLKLQKEEAEGRKSQEALSSVLSAFRQNFIARRFVVAELRKLGEEVKDPYIPLSDMARR